MQNYKTPIDSTGENWDDIRFGGDLDITSLVWFTKKNNQSAGLL
jgi:hypothetical protein